MSLSIHIKKKMQGFTLQVDWETKENRLAIAGPSGCGKSMTLKTIAGIVTPDEGKIVLNGTTLFDSEKKVDMRIQKRHTGYLFQNYALFPTMTVEKNIAAGLKGNKANIQAKVDEMVKLFRLDGLQKHLPKELSGGQQQRVALARIMASNPEIIMLDEPFSALDEYLKEQLWLDMAHFLEYYQGMVVLVSHSKEEVYRFSDELMILEQGKTVETGGTKYIFEHPGCQMSARLTGYQNLSSVKQQNNILFFEDWGFSKQIEDGVSYVGAACKAEDFVEVEENGILATILSKEEGIDSCKYLLETQKDKILIWKTKNRSFLEGMQCHIDIPENKLKLF